MFISQFINYISTSDDGFHLSRILSSIQQFPISKRKIVITACQLQDVDDQLFRNISLESIDYHTRSPLSRQDFIHSLSHVVSSSVESSILWMFLRTVPEPTDNDESNMVRAEGFEKEFLASQTKFNENQQVSYSAFFRNAPGINDPGMWWVHQVKSITSKLVRGLSGKVLYPQVNRNKNTSDQTKAEFNTYEPSDYVRTVDLELLYHRTGIRIGGNCEIRDAWKFNDLKPRMYYCIGGQQYWASSYIKLVAVAIMEAIPSSQVKLRTKPADFLSSDLDTDYVMAWDFTSFTTTLSELKYFLWNIARVLEREKTQVTLFDYRYGFTTVNVYELIDHYNEVVNLHAPFELHRMVGRFIDENQLSAVQMNSGMLGVPGNIGFSTALHGFVVCKECGAHRCVCVGDDALGITPEKPIRRLIPALQSIGAIHPDKFDLLNPAEDERYIKFLKRRFTRVGNGFIMNHLFNFPIAPYIDGETGSRTVPIDFSEEARVFKVASQTASLLWEIHENCPIVSDSDIRILRSFLVQAYRRLRMPFNGAFPGTSLPQYTDCNGRPLSIGFTIPGILNFDPREVDWLDFMIGNAPSLFFKAPVFVTKYDEVLNVGVGEVAMYPESVYLSCLEDLGYVRTENVTEWIMVAGVDSARILRRMNRKVDDGLVKAVMVKGLKEIPAHFLRTVVKEYKHVDETRIQNDL